MLFSLLTGIVFYLATLTWVESDAREQFAYQSRNAQNTISARIKSYTNVLRAAASLFQTSDRISRQQFHNYVEGLSLARFFPAIEVINYAEYVRDEELEEFVRRNRAEQASPSGQKRFFHVYPPGKRAGYSVLTFIEPGERFAGTLGLDIQAKPTILATMMDSRDSGTLITSGQPIAAISGPNRTGLGMRLPIYQRAMPSETVEQRRAAYIGSVGIAFSVHMLVKGVLDEMPIPHVRMTLIDSGPTFDPSKLSNTVLDRVMYDSAGTDSLPTPPLANKQASHFSETLPVDFNGRLWKATFSTSKQDLYTGFDAYFPWIAMVLGFIGAMLFHALLHTLTSSRQSALNMAREMTRELRESEAELKVSHRNLRRLAAHADQIKEGERKRIAREIHDDLGQNLLALRIEADMLATRTSERQPRLHQRARATLRQIDLTIKSVRQIINDLRPNVLDLGLSAAVEWQIAEFRQRTGIACELIGASGDIGLNDHRATAIFRILQESLSNIQRHAAASAVVVDLHLMDGELSMKVRDNGVGLHAGGRNKAGSFGLVGIEERINMLGGSFSIISAPGCGTTICVTVPISEEHASSQALPAATAQVAATALA
jgi:signal transduction histidine kinase